MLPAAKIAVEHAVDAGLADVDSVNAASETCMPPKTAPMPRNATIRTRTPGTRQRGDVLAASPRAGAGATGRLGAPLRGEQQPADQRQRGLGDQAGRRVDAGAQRGRQHRADDEGELVGHGLEGGGGRHQRASPEPGGPAGPHHRADLRRRGARWGRPPRTAPTGARAASARAIRAQTASGVHQDAGDQHRALAEAVGELAALRGEQGHGDTGRGGDGARGAVRAGGVLRRAARCRWSASRRAAGPAKPGSRKVQAPGVRSSVSVAGTASRRGDRGCHGRAFLPPGSAPPARSSRVRAESCPLAQDRVDTAWSAPGVAA